MTSSTNFDWKSLAEDAGVFLFRMLLQFLAIPIQLILFVVSRFIGKPAPAKEPANIVITGASSGIGEGFALDYAKPGITLGLTGRNAERLAITAQACEAKGAQVVQMVVDVVDRQGMENALQAFDEQHPIDLVIANAGVSETSAGADRDDIPTATRIVFETNITGVLNTVLPIIPWMQKRRSGQIAFVTSLAGYGSMTASASYSASKACVQVYGESLRGVLARDNIHVNVIAPGYVKSPMTDLNKFHMPFKWTIPEALAFMRRGLQRNDALITFPWQLSSLRFFDARFLLPEIRDWLGRNRFFPHLAWLQPKSNEELPVARPVASRAGERKQD